MQVHGCACRVIIRSFYTLEWYSQICVFWYMILRLQVAGFLSSASSVCRSFQKFSLGLELTNLSQLVCPGLDAMLGFSRWSWWLGILVSPSDLFCGVEVGVSDLGLNHNFEVLLFRACGFWFFHACRLSCCPSGSVLWWGSLPLWTRPSRFSFVLLLPFFWMRMMASHMNNNNNKMIYNLSRIKTPKLSINRKCRHIKMYRLHIRSSKHSMSQKSPCILKVNPTTKWCSHPIKKSSTS